VRRRRTAGLVSALPLLLWAAGALAQSRPDVELLPESEYATQLEEVVVRGARAPAWRDRLEEKPRWDRPALELEPAEPPRIEWLPRYAREEREDFDGVRDRQNAEPRLRLFELRF
jgi:hypothetical protein